jgi:hypothetical protein
MVAKKVKKATRKVGNLPSQALGAKHAHKHLAGVKYEDITIDPGTGTSKTTS